MEPIPEIVKYWNSVPDGEKLRADYSTWNEADQQCFNRAVQYLANATPGELKQAISYMERATP